MKGSGFILCLWKRGKNDNSIKAFIVIYLINKNKMEPENIMLSEISQVVKDKYHMISPLIGT